MHAVQPLAPETAVHAPQEANQCHNAECRASNPTYVMHPAHTVHKWPSLHTVLKDECDLQGHNTCKRRTTSAGKETLACQVLVRQYNVMNVRHQVRRAAPGMLPTSAGQRRLVAAQASAQYR